MIILLIVPITLQTHCATRFPLIETYSYTEVRLTEAGSKQKKKKRKQLSYSCFKMTLFYLHVTLKSSIVMFSVLDGK